MGLTDAVKRKNHKRMLNTVIIKYVTECVRLCSAFTPSSLIAGASVVDERRGRGLHSLVPQLVDGRHPTHTSRIDSSYPHFVDKEADECTVLRGRTIPDKRISSN